MEVLPTQPHKEMFMTIEDMDWRVFNYLKNNLRLDVGRASSQYESCPDRSYTEVPISLILTSPNGEDHVIGSGSVVVDN